MFVDRPVSQRKFICLLFQSATSEDFAELLIDGLEMAASDVCSTLTLSILHLSKLDLSILALSVLFLSSANNTIDALDVSELKLRLTPVFNSALLLEAELVLLMAVEDCFFPNPAKENNPADDGVCGIVGV